MGDNGNYEVELLHCEVSNDTYTATCDSARPAIFCRLPDYRTLLILPSWRTLQTHTRPAQKLEASFFSMGILMKDAIAK